MTRCRWKHTERLKHEFLSLVLPTSKLFMQHLDPHLKFIFLTALEKKTAIKVTCGTPNKNECEFVGSIPRTPFSFDKSFKTAVRLWLAAVHRADRMQIRSPDKQPTQLGKVSQNAGKITISIFCLEAPAFRKAAVLMKQSCFSMSLRILRTALQRINWNTLPRTLNGPRPTIIISTSGAEKL